MFTPWYSAESKAGENASPENNVNVDGNLYWSNKVLKNATPALGSVFDGCIS